MEHRVRNRVGSANGQKPVVGALGVGAGRKGVARGVPRITSWLESAHGGEAPEARASAGAAETRVRNPAASNAACSRSKLNAWPTPVGVA